jgi:hypothetical protein
VFDVAERFTVARQCVFCDLLAESAAQIIVNSPYVKEVWQQLPSAFSQAANIGANSSSILNWWSMIWKLPKLKASRSQAIAAVYVSWNLWK